MDLPQKENRKDAKWGTNVKNARGEVRETRRKHPPMFYRDEINHLKTSSVPPESAHAREGGCGRATFFDRAET